MKKYFIALAVIFIFAISTTSSAKALVYEGDPSGNANHFVWGLMSSMETPDDADCSSLALALLNSDGTIPAGERAAIATAACNGIASMRTNMQSDMQSGGAVETNLWDATDWHTVNNLYFEHSTDGFPDGRISFSMPIDFMSYNFLNFMAGFGENMDSRTGYISLDAETVGGFANYGASLTMYNIPEFDNPEILVNGNEDSSGVVSNLVYNRGNNTITFSAAHFSSFEVVEASEAEINKVNYLRFKDDKGQEKIKITLYGDNFEKNARVKFGSKKAYKTKKVSSRKIIAYFMMSEIEKELAKAKRSSLRVSIKNRNQDIVYARNKKIIKNIAWKK